MSSEVLCNNKLSLRCRTIHCHSLILVQKVQIRFVVALWNSMYIQNERLEFKSQWSAGFLNNWVFMKTWCPKTNCSPKSFHSDYHCHILGANPRFWDTRPCSIWNYFANEYCGSLLIFPSYIAGSYIINILLGMATYFRNRFESIETSQGYENDFPTRLPSGIFLPLYHSYVSFDGGFPVGKVWVSTKGHPPKTLKKNDLSWSLMISTEQRSWLPSGTHTKKAC